MNLTQFKKKLKEEGCNYDVVDDLKVEKIIKITRNKFYDKINKEFVSFDQAMLTIWNTCEAEEIIMILKGEKEYEGQY